MIAALFMHAIDIEIAEVVDRWLNPSGQEQSMIDSNKSKNGTNNNEIINNNNENDNGGINQENGELNEPTSPEHKGMLRCPLQDKVKTNSSILGNDDDNVEIAGVSLLEEKNTKGDQVMVHCHCTQEAKQNYHNV